MKRFASNSVVIIFSLLSYVLPSSAALPPEVQSRKDLDVMMHFVHQHPEVSSTLKSINVLNYTIDFGVDCKAEFGRKFVFKLPGWVGPADPLEFKSSNCPID